MNSVRGFGGEGFLGAGMAKRRGKLGVYTCTRHDPLPETTAQAGVTRRES